jgi:DNA-binding CsgD family transcriptional regulator
MANVCAVDQLRSGTAVFSTDPEGRITEWNAEAERLTGIAAPEAVGRPCWEVIAGRNPDGGLVCHPGCSAVRLVREGWPVRPLQVDVPTANGEMRLALSTIVLRGEEPLILHTLHAAAAARPPAPLADCVAELTPRQREILLLLGRGVRARQIAAQLMLSETTVRNHIQSILLSLGVHSQLEAVARARELSRVDDQTAA